MWLVLGGASPLSVITVKIGFLWRKVLSVKEKEG